MYPIPNHSLLPWNWSIETSTTSEKVGMEQRKMPIKYLWMKEKNIPNTISYLELLMTTMQIKSNFWAGHQYEMQKSRDGGRNAYKIFKSLVEEVNIPNTISYVELFMATMTFMKMKNNSSALRSSLVHFPAQASKN